MADTDQNAPATKAELANLHVAVKADLDHLHGLVKTDLSNLRLDMLERIEHVETTLLKEFRKWAVRNDSTLRVHDARSIGYDQRLSVLEERVAELEDRK
jgi:hypothetical protein